MALSAAFCLCICGGISWKSQGLVQISHCNAWDDSLSKIWNLGRIPLSMRLSLSLEYDLKISASVLFFIGSVKIALES